MKQALIDLINAIPDGVSVWYANDRVSYFKALLGFAVDSVPSQTNDADWWPDDLTEAMNNARKIL